MEQIALRAGQVAARAGVPLQWELPNRGKGSLTCKEGAMTTTLACRLDAFDGAQTLRYQELRRAMNGVGEPRELPDGYAVRFPADPTLFMKVAEWITLERLCCSFLAFGLDWSEDDGVLLRLTGGPGVKTFLGTLMSQLRG